MKTILLAFMLWALQKSNGQKVVKRDTTSWGSIYIDSVDKNQYIQSSIYSLLQPYVSNNPTDRVFFIKEPQPLFAFWKCGSDTLIIYQSDKPRYIKLENGVVITIPKKD